MSSISVAAGAPAPTIDEHSAPFWAALRQRRIVLQQCTACRRRRFPPMPTCPYCGGDGHDDTEIPGTGTVYSFIRAHRALSPAYEELAPYAIATVDLDGGGRVFARVVPVEQCEIGARVHPLFADHPADKVSEGWTELCFEISLL